MRNKPALFAGMVLSPAATTQAAVLAEGDRYHVILESVQVRGLEYRDSPGDVTRRDHHPASVLHALASFRRTIALPDGKVLVREFKAGDAIEPEALTRIGSNVGDSPTYVIVVELKVAPPMHSVLMVYPAGGAYCLHVRTIAALRVVQSRCHSESNPMNVPVEARTGMPTPVASIEWSEADEARSARWQSEAGLPPPRRVVVADDTMKADTAYQLACAGTALLWRGDFQNARLLLQAVSRRVDGLRRKPGRPGKRVRAEPSQLEAFHLYRMAQAQRARILGMLLIPFESDFVIPLRRAPEVATACSEAGLSPDGPMVMSLRELQGLIGAHEWRRRGVLVTALEARIHPHYGVFSPVRGEYLDLVASAPLPPATKLAFDIGTGSGVLAALLARRGVARVVATDQDQRAIACARENIERLGYAAQVEVRRADLFPEGKAQLVVCNPPWLPAKPTSPLEHSVYDPDSRMLRGFLAAVAEHLAPGGEAWLVLSDLAEHLGLRSRAALLEMFEGAGLEVIGRLDTTPRHGRSKDQDDPLHAARAAEVTSLWRLGVPQS